MKIKNIIRFVVQNLARCIPFASRWHVAPVPLPEQLDLGLDQITATGLPLREAIPVRSAEYWLRFGEPDLALKELETLPESAHQHAWPRRVHLAALNAAAH